MWSCRSDRAAPDWPAYFLLVIAIIVIRCFEVAGVCPAGIGHSRQTRMELFPAKCPALKPRLTRPTHPERHSGEMPGGILDSVLIGSDGEQVFFATDEDLALRDCGGCLDFFTKRVSRKNLEHRSRLNDNRLSVVCHEIDSSLSRNR